MGYPKTIERVGKTKKRNHEKDFLSGSFGSPGTDKCECTGKVQARSHDSLDRIELFARRCYRWGLYSARVWSQSASALEREDGRPPELGTEHDYR